MAPSIQPMETAPRDGSMILVRVLVYEPKTVLTVARWEDKRGWGSTPGWVLTVHGAHATDDDVDPIGWYPLPPGLEQ